MDIRTANTVTKNKRFVDSRQTNRLLDAGMASQNARPALMLHASNCKVIGCVFDNVGHPCVGVWSDSPWATIEDCIAFNYGCIDNTNPANNDTNMNRRGTDLYGQSPSHDVITKKIRCVSYGGFNQDGHCYTQSKFVSGFQYEDGAAFNPGRGELFIFMCEKAIKNSAFRNYSIFIDKAPNNKEIAGIKFKPGDIFSDGTSSRLELNGNVIVNYSGPVFDITATGLVGKDNVFCSRNGHVLAKVQSANLTRDPNGLVNTQWFDPDGAGFELNGAKVGWDQFKAATGDKGSYLKALPTNRVRSFPSTNYPGRTLVNVFQFTPQPTITLTLQGMTSGQKYVVIDTQNIDGAPLFTGTYNPSKPTVSVPLPAANAPVNPVKGTVDNPFSGQRCTTLIPLLVLPI